ncbi:(p)ppGpp synthetase I, SpoT/RelA [Acidimicrobium ferrooxidans DSM 10331]|uniref:(P)ppGpp synthetase I, SpoT/RelA n=1 Tax=Acidimicrobium ferrooxidans (strain DSM 10331 / JCM 15462 / NBRC 103882 / ICP) TaxID=525909 RepID=C7LYS8_ACIFD|nr:bifunctional (p)ppGpp synthetase/guanosine-3',5'-bis(diphosphate) 3'-pyrophosphohydrolase [Acidimicrobium ferrooxidans]ACU53886.1 (p)ppGpp synthetase I, SpoT/RelA [Acidimicrobium ferrooxidans DSM 10331]
MLDERWLAERYADNPLVLDALALATKAHHGQLRRSGEPYIVHPLAVARRVAELRADPITVAAALLHDTVEDTSISLEELEQRFGAEVAALVDGATKLDRLSFDSKEVAQAATMRKMLIAMARDVRVLVIKLADRLHNMQTIGALGREKQRRIAHETMDIYAPLAHRLGIEEVKWQLEDHAFAVLHPRRYAEMEHLVSQRAPEREARLQAVSEQLAAKLAQVGIVAEVTARPKHVWSIYEKMVLRGKEFDAIYDILGVRIITHEERDCWAALGVIHSLWAPIPGRFKDYINAPKFNLYQSLHTTVVLEGGSPLEVQVRTREMHLRAEYGVAAHWGYKEGSDAAELAWLGRLIDLDEETHDPVEFLEHLKLDLGTDEIYVFTPKGKVITLPTGATPLDFAYAIHTEVGHRCVGAKVNGRLVALETELRSGDTVEVVTSRSATAGPSRDWLAIVRTPRARSKIRQWFSRERREESIDAGREELARELRREGLSVTKHLSGPGLARLAEQAGYREAETLLAAIGEGHVSARSVLAKVQRAELEHDGFEPAVATPQRRRRGGGGPSIWVEGLDDVLVRLARCCNPLPGDAIVGFITQGRGVAIHREDCPNVEALLAQGPERMVEVDWAGEHGSGFQMAIEIEALDRPRLLADVSRVLAEHHVNILASSSGRGSDLVAAMRFEFELADPSHLSSILAGIRQLDGVFNAARVVPGRRRPRTATQHDGR